VNPASRDADSRSFLLQLDYFALVQMTERAAFLSRRQGCHDWSLPNAQGCPRTLRVCQMNYAIRGFEVRHVNSDMLSVLRKPNKLTSGRGNACQLRQTRNATLRTRTANHPPSSCTNRGDVSQVTILFWCVSKCEQRLHCFGVTVLLTWRVGALRSILERVDIFLLVRPLRFANARRAPCISGRPRSPSHHVTPRKSCDQSRNVER
jgi:hypothetical protein